MEQSVLKFGGRGGARKGAGRPRTREPGVSHSRRAELSGREPVHVTLSLLDHVWNLRTNRCFAVIREAFVQAGLRSDFRVVALTVQDRHLHLLVEAASAAALTRGIHALKIRLAAGLNRLMGRRGPVFDERYHEHVLRSVAEACHAQTYVLANTFHHAAQVGRVLPRGYRNPYTIGFFGAEVRLPDGTAAMVAPPETWLLREGWRAGSTAPVSRPPGRRSDGDRAQRWLPLLGVPSAQACPSPAPPGLANPLDGEGAGRAA